jgi:hypothetical protein
MVLDLRSDGSAMFDGNRRMWRDEGKTIELYAGTNAEFHFRKEGQDLIKIETGSRYVKVRNFHDK